MYSTKFMVVLANGPARFPLDMLRYDHCFPDTQEDVNLVGDALENPTSQLPSTVPAIGLRVRHQIKYAPGITPARWLSFGWRVLPIKAVDVVKL